MKRETESNVRPLPPDVMRALVEVFKSLDEMHSWIEVDGGRWCKVCGSFDFARQ